MPFLGVVQYKTTTFTIRRPALNVFWHAARRDGPDLFAAACRMGLGLVSKRRDHPYQAGQSKHWVNYSPAHLPEHAKVSPSDA